MAKAQALQTLILYGLLLFSSLSAAAEIKMVASTPILAQVILDLTKNADTVQVQSILSSQEDTHHFEIRPSQFSAIKMAQTFYYHGTSIDSWVRGSLLNAAPRVMNLNSKCNNTEAQDPHIWLSKLGLSCYYQNVAADLISEYPRLKDSVTANLTILIKQLSEIEQLTQQKIKSSKGKELQFISEHIAYTHFFKSLDLPYSSLQNGHHFQEISPKALASFLKRASTGKYILFPESEKSGKALARLLSSEKNISFSRPLLSDKPVQREGHPQSLIEMYQYNCDVLLQSLTAAQKLYPNPSDQ